MRYSKSAKAAFIALTLAYIFWQISLSGAILSASDIQSSERLSSLARWTVGLGGFLFTFRVCWGRKFTKRGSQGFWTIPAILGLIIGIAFVWTEDAVVNHFADKADAQSRMDARTIQLFNSAFLQGKAVLPDLPASISENPVMASAFSKVLGFAIWSNPALIKSINDSRQKIITALNAEAAYEKIDAGYNEYISAMDKVLKANAALRKIPYAEWAEMLNPQLGSYAACISDKCRADIRERISGYLKNYFSKTGFPLDLDFDPENFCVTRHEKRYAMGREIKGQESRICHASEDSLQKHAEGMLRKALNESLPENAQLPEKIRERLLDVETPLSLDEWRAMFKDAFAEETGRKEKEEFGDPSVFGETGSQAAEGRNLAISIFLPPVALGFSVLVCILHLANIMTMFFGHPVIWTGCGITLAFSPLLFSPGVPLAGFAGYYARWLLEWEAMLYPLGIFRGLII